MYNFYGTNIRLVKSKYQYTDSLAILAYTEDGELYTVVTKCFPDFYLWEEQDLAFIDINNNPGIEEFLINNSIAKSLHFGFDSGFVSYPLYKFDLNKLEEE